MFGSTELIIILIIVFVIFGAGKLPKVMGDFGKGVSSFKKGMKEEGSAPENKQESLSEQTDSDKKEG